MPKVRISCQTWLSNTTFQGKKGFLLPGFNYIYMFFLSQHAKFKEKAVSYSCPYQHCAISD